MRLSLWGPAAAGRRAWRHAPRPAAEGRRAWRHAPQAHPAAPGVGQARPPSSPSNLTGPRERDGLRWSQAPAHITASRGGRSENRYGQTTGTNNKKERGGKTKRDHRQKMRVGKRGAEREDEGEQLLPVQQTKPLPSLFVNFTVWELGPVPWNPQIKQNTINTTQICLSLQIYIYIYIERERERERETDIYRYINSALVHMHLHMYGLHMDLPRYLVQCPHRLPRDT